MVINFLEINLLLGSFPPHPLTASLQRPPDKISNYVQGKVEQGQSKAPSSEAAAPGCVQAARALKTGRPWHITQFLHARLATPGLHYCPG